MFGKNLSFSKIHIDSFFFYLLCFYPFILITGPFLSDLCLVVVVIYFVSKTIIDRTYYKFKRLGFLIFLIFSLYLIINSLLIAKEFLSFKSAIFYFRFGIFSLAVGYIISENLNKISFLKNSMLIIVILLSIDSIFQNYFKFNLIGIPMLHESRISSFFGEELILGSFIVKIIPALIALVFFLKVKNKLIISFVILIVSIFPIILSAEKAAVATYLIFCLMFLLIIDIKFKLKVIFVVTLISIISTLLIFNENHRDRLVHQLISNSQGGKYIFSMVHHSHYRTAYNMFLDKPMFGHGPKMFRVKCSDEKYEYNKFGCSTHPHNYYIQLLAETGLFGFGFLMLFYLIIFKEYLKNLYKAIKKKETDYVRYFLICSMLLIFLPISPSGNFFNNYVASGYSFFFGLFYCFFILKPEIARHKNLDIE